jgi:hypothetical protein
MRHFKYSPELQVMMKKSVHFPATHIHSTEKPKPIIVQQVIGDHVVEAVGTMVERNGLDGWGWTSCIRWKVDGHFVNKTNLLLKFGIEV